MRKWGPLAAVCLGTFMLLLDVTIVVVSLPEMASALDASLSDLQWVIDIYALALAALLLGAGAAGDAVGRRRVYVGGTALFAAASFVCGIAPNPGVLVAARAVQGAGGAAMFATTLSLLGAAYQGRERSLALGVWGAVAGAAAALGPVLGGVITEGAGWRWIFFVNLPVSVAAIWLSLRSVSGGGGAAGRRIDWAGTGTFTAFAGATTFGVVRAGAEGWTSAPALGSFALAVVALALFVAVERRVPQPLIDLALFRRPAFVGVMAGGLAVNAAAFGVLPYTSLWLQTLLGMSPVRGGLVLLPCAGAAFVVAGAGGRLLHRAPPRIVMGVGLLLIGAGVLGQAVLDAGSSWPALVPGLAVTGVGVGLVTPALAGAALASVPQERAGMAGGAVNTFRQLGYALGVAAFGTVVTSRMASSLADDTPHPHAAAHALAGGGAESLHGSVPAAALRAAFASGLDTAAVAAGVVGLVAGCVVLALGGRSASAAAQPAGSAEVAERV